MSIFLLGLCAAHGAEFDVGAAAEGVAHMARGTAGAGVRQLEVDGRLDLGGVLFRADIDVLVPPTAWPDGLWADVRVYPEWAQLQVKTGGGWAISGGARPLTPPAEAVDGWRNTLAPMSRNFELHWPGQLLGVWADGAMKNGLEIGAWGGARTWPGAPIPELGESLPIVVGGGLGVVGDGVTIRTSTHLLPVDVQHATTVAVEVPLEKVAAASGLWLTGWPGDAMRLSGWARAELFPQEALIPVARVEWAEGWLADAGVAWRPQSFLQLAATGRIEADRLWVFAELAIFEDPEIR